MTTLKGNVASSFRDKCSMLMFALSEQIESVSNERGDCRVVLRHVPPVDVNGRALMRLGSTP